MRKIIIDSLLSHAKGQIDKHKANVEIYLKNPVGIGEHSDVLEAIEGELNTISKYEEQIDILKKYFIETEIKITNGD